MRWYLAGLLALTMTASARGDIITQWNFNGTTPDGDATTGTTAPNLGVGSASLVGGTTASFASGDSDLGSSDPSAGDDSAWNTTSYPTQGTVNGSAGVQFNVSTVGFESIVINYDLRHSSNSSRYERFQYSLDGSTFVNLSPLFIGDAGDTWFNARTIDLSSIAGAADNPNFAFRVVASFGVTAGLYVGSNLGSPYETTGTWRFDMVTVNGVAVAVPEPASLALVGLGLVGLGGLAIRRRPRAS